MGGEALATAGEAEPVHGRRPDVDLSFADRRLEAAAHLVAVRRDAGCSPTSTQSAFTSRKPAALTCV